MSTCVFTPLVMSEMRRVMSRRSSDASGTPATIARVRRDLFGPVNHEESQSFVDKELAAIRKRESEKWGFDFERETPLEHPRYRWERLTPEENLPESYALRRLSLKLKPTTERSRPAETSTTSTSNSNKTSDCQDTTTTQKQKSASRQTQMTGLELPQN
ncbi:hypothetical protein J6590_052111 [Homalodisca vitripennis]|nr:hypothetical protein J6590_052111 [Homalodisca vitripennis]